MCVREESWRVEMGEEGAQESSNNNKNGTVLLVNRILKDNYLLATCTHLIDY